MTPAARLQAAIEILDALESTPAPADRFIRDWFRRRRYAGSKDRASIAERVFDVLRHRAFLSWRMGSENSRALVIGTLLRDGANPESIRALFSGDGYGPAPLSDDEIGAVRNPPLGDPPLWVQGGYPQWLEAELTRALGADLLDEMTAMQGRASVDLRVNTLKATRADVLSALKAQGFEATTTRTSPFGIRVAPGASGLDKTKLFQSGAFELQDEASQIASLLIDAKPGMRVLDLAAGGGGKSLAMAATMNNEGEIVATDIDAGRLQQLAIRAERAGVTIIKLPPPERGRAASASEPSGGQATQRSGMIPPRNLPTANFDPPFSREGFDRVLVDAPCSGTGTWRRQPELRWRLTPERLDALRKTQDWLLDDGARHTRPGGRLIYATCSLLPCENEDRIEAFLARHSDFAIVPVRTIWPESIGTDPPHGLSDFFRARPWKTGTDGFFTAILQRRDG